MRYFYSDSFRASRPSYPVTEQFGFIAQEFQQVLPDSVVQRDDGLLQLNVSSLVPYTVRGVQELITRVDEQEAVIEDQQRQIDELKAMMQQLLDQQ